MDTNKPDNENTNEQENEYCKGCGSMAKLYKLDSSNPSGECDGCYRQSHPNYNYNAPISIDDRIDEMINNLFNISKDFIIQFFTKIGDIIKNGLFTK